MILEQQTNDIRKKSLVLMTALSACVLTALLLLKSYVANQKNILIAFLCFAFSSSILYAYSFFEKFFRNYKGFYVGIGTNAITAIICAFGINALYCSIYPDRLFASSSIVRTLLFFLAMLLVNCFVIYDPASVLELLHNKRWLIAVCVFVFMVALNLNLSNASTFHYYIQPNIKGDFTLPILGTPRDIRSDEWLVDTPRRASAAYNNYGLYNYICRATENFGISASYLYLSFSSLSNPFNFGYYLLGTEYGAAFHWCGLLILGIFISYEFSLIISKGNRRIAILGSALLGLSSFSLWWSINVHIIAVLSLLVCAYYYFNTDSFKKQILLAIGVAMSASTFICQLYPAWQVPLAYILIALFAWIVVENFDKIKRMKKKQWITVASAFIFMCAIVVSYLYDTREYSKAIMETVYPGSRFDAGSNYFFKGSWYIQTLLYPFKNTGNNSEAGTFFSLFPLPMIFAALIFARQVYARIKNKDEKVDMFFGLLLLPTILLILYCTVGVPAWLAKITLLGYSMSARAVDLLCFLNVLFLLRIVTPSEDKNRFVPISVGVGISVLLLLYNIKTTTTYYPQYMNLMYVGVISLIVVSFALILISKVPTKFKNSVVAITTAAVVISGISVLPINRGLDAIFDKPASYQIQSIREQEPEAKWIGYDSIVTPQFLIANGAPTVNSVNYIPNMSLWQTLDENGLYNEVYNRYAHVSVVFCEEDTWFQLLQADCMVLHLSYKDIIKTDVKYLYSMYGLSENSDYIDLELLYNEDNAFIYKVTYN